MQDDEEDQTREITKMGQIYRNAILNVGAMAAAEGDAAGLFADRDPEVVSPFALTIKRKGYQHMCFAFFDDIADFQHCSLFRRGWVLQERLLSRRTVYFGKQLRWECSTTVATEAFPNRTPGWSGTEFPGIDGPFRLGTLLTRRSGVATGKHWKDNENYEGWQDIAEKFTQCKLSYDEYFLPAISGLAYSFQAELDSQYHAGLWRNDLVNGLLWHRGILTNDECPPRQLKYRGRLQTS